MFGNFEEQCDALQLAMTAIGTERNEYRLEVDGKIENVEKCLARKIDCKDFIWTIDRLTERKNGTWIDSEYFNIRTERYKMRLGCYWRYGGGDAVWIQLLVYADEDDANLRWPFERRVTIPMSNNASPNVRRDITNQCQMEKPPITDYRWSDLFTFSHRDLSNAGLLLGNRINVKCIVDNE